MAEYPTLVAKCPECGRVIAAFIQNPDHMKDHAKEIAALVRHGFALETMPTEDARRAEWGHAGTCAKKRKTKKAA